MEDVKENITETCIPMCYLINISYCTHAFMGSYIMLPSIVFDCNYLMTSPWTHTQSHILTIYTKSHESSVWVLYSLTVKFQEEGHTICVHKVGWAHLSSSSSSTHLSFSPLLYLPVLPFCFLFIVPPKSTSLHFSFCLLSSFLSCCPFYFSFSSFIFIPLSDGNETFTKRHSEKNLSGTERGITAFLPLNRAYDHSGPFLSDGVWVCVCICLQHEHI